jgi:hypothetical protein
MRIRTLGKTGIKVSEVGFGAWAIGGPAELGGVAVGWSKADDRDSIRALETAFDEGINFYDTADVYGMGHSEELLSQVFSQRRAQVVIASKGGNLNDEAGRWQKNFTGVFLARKVEDSLRRLRTDYLDLYQLHTPRTDEEYEQALTSAETLTRLVEQGKVRAYGLSIGSLEHGLRQIAPRLRRDDPGGLQRPGARTGGKTPASGEAGQLRHHPASPIGLRVPHGEVHQYHPVRYARPPLVPDGGAEASLGGESQPSQAAGQGARDHRGPACPAVHPG